MARIAGVDLPNNKRLWIGLTSIYGIGQPRARSICALAKVDETKKVKDLTEEEVNQLRQQIEKTTSDYDRDKLKERLGKLAGGVAVIRVGAPSESEMKSRKEALDDAISSTRAAIAEGIVPGGGLALLRVMDAVEREEDNCTGDERTGLRILKHALKEPARQIAENSGEDGGVVIHEMRTHSGNWGYDAARRKYVDLVEAGVIDATKVVRLALENAASAATLLLLSEATLTEVPERKENAPPGIPE